MKKLILLSAFMAIIICLSSFQKVTAQTNGIQLYYAGDSTYQNYYCSVPASVNFLIYGSSGNYTPALDSVLTYMNFGDGADSLFYSPVYSGQNTFWVGFDHIYTTPGTFSLQIIVTAPNGDADTVIDNNAIVISNSCGNISGTIYLDEDGDCIQDVGEPGIPYGMLEITDGNGHVSYASTDTSGQYSLNVPVGGTYNIAYSDQGFYTGYSVTCPSSGEYNVTSIPSSGLDFGLDCPSGFDLIGDLWGWGYRPGFTGYIWADAFNTGCFPVSGQVKLVLDPLLTYVNANPVPDNIIGDTLIWNFTNLNSSIYYNYYSGYYVEVLTSPSANLGDSICNLLIVEPIAGDIDPSNNIITRCDTVRNSWDPNDKSVDQGSGDKGYVEPNTDLSYTIHFQNTGNAEAVNIYIIDTLDANLNPASLKILSSSHPLTFSIGEGNAIRFEFDNIMLPDSTSDLAGSNGYVRYSISQKQDLPDLTEIQNTAYIYFDFNPAIITNQTLNTVSIIEGIGESLNAESLSIFPVPADKILTLTIPSVVDHAVLQIFDLEGRIIYKQMVNGGNLGINVENFRPGVYTVLLSSDTKIYSSKAMVIH
jgi:uncharacterized repeat protein (TIGR01451 family)